MNSIGANHNLKVLQWLLLAVFVIVLGWYYSPGTWNAAARYDAIYALVEEGTFSIDSFIINPHKNINTGDWAQYNGRYYSSKAPGSILLGAAVYAPLYWPLRAAGFLPSPGVEIFLAWWINLWVSVIPLALSAVVLLRLLLERGSSMKSALFWCIAYAFATPLWPYATQLWGHPLAAAALTAGIWLLWRPEQPRPILAGVAASVAVLADYGAALALPWLILPILCERRNWRMLPQFILGGLPALAIFAGYHWWCFGTPFTIANAYANPVFLQSSGAGGMMTTFSPLVLWKLLFGSHRGLFWGSPILLAAIPGAIAALTHPGKRIQTLSLCAMPITGLLLNSAYGYWHGGFSTSPRFILYAIPAVILLASELPLTKQIPRQMALFVLLALSCFNMYTLCNISPIIPDNRLSPIYQDAWWMCWQDGARNLNRSRGVRLHYWEKDNRHYAEKAVISPGRLIHPAAAPWLDLGLFVGFLALSAGVIRRRSPQLTLKAITAPWRQWLAQMWHAHGKELLRNPWCYATIAALTLTFILPGITLWRTQERQIIDAALEPMLLNQLRWQNPGALFWQLLLTFHPTPIGALMAKNLLATALTIAAAVTIARQKGASPWTATALALALPGWWMLSRSITPAPLLVPALLWLYAGTIQTYRATGRPKVRIAWAIWSILSALTVIIEWHHATFKQPCLFFHWEGIKGLWRALSASTPLPWPIGLFLGLAMATLVAAAMTAWYMRWKHSIGKAPAIVLSMLTGALLTLPLWVPCLWPFWALATVVAYIAALTHPSNRFLNASITLGGIVAMALLLMTLQQNGGSRHPAMGSTLKEQWKIAQEITALESQGNRLTVYYNPPQESLLDEDFEALLDMAYLSRPYKLQIYGKRPRNPMDVTLDYANPTGNDGKLTIITEE